MRLPGSRIVTAHAFPIQEPCYSISVTVVNAWFNEPHRPGSVDLTFPEGTKVFDEPQPEILPRRPMGACESYPGIRNRPFRWPNPTPWYRRNQWLP